MATIKQIQFKRTKKPGVKPTPDQIAEGELAINLADRTLFTSFDGNIIDLGFAKGGNVDGNINQVSGNFSTTGSIAAGGPLDAKTGTFDYTVRLLRTTGATVANKPLAIQSDGTSTNDMLIQHWGAGNTRESILEFKFGTSASHAATKMGMMLQRFTDNNIGFDVNGYANIATSVVAGTYVKAGGENGLITTAFTGGAAPIRTFQIGNFSSATYENAIQFTDGGTWLGELGTRKTIRPSNQTKTEFKVNGNITSIGNAESFRLVYQDYGTFWRNDGASLYLMQTAQGDADGSFNTLRPFRLNLVSGDVSIHTTTIQNQPGKNWIGIGAAVTPNADPLGVAGLTTMVAVGDSDTGIGQRGDGNLELLANNIPAIKITSGRVLTIRPFTAQIQDSLGRIVMPANNTAILTVDGSAEPNQATNGVTLIGYNSGDKYHHYFRGNGNFVVNMPYATFDKDVYFGGYINAAYVHSRGSIYTGAVPQDTYKWDDLNIAGNNGAKSYLRRFRSQGSAIIWHETCTHAEVVISTGATDNSPVWGYNTGGIWTNGALSAKNASLNGTGGGNSVVILQDGQTVTGEPNGLVRGAIEGGAWTTWRTRSSGLQVNIAREDSAYNIWKATLWGKNHVAAMEVIHNASIVDAAARIQVHNTNFDFSASGGFSTPARGYFGGDISTGANVRATGAIYWGPNGAWAASDGNIYGTQWGEGGALAWMGGNVVKLWGDQVKKGNLFLTTGSLYANNSSIYIQGEGNKHLWFRNNAGAEKGLIYNQADGTMILRTNGAAGLRTWTFNQAGSLTAPGDITSATWMYATEFYLNSDYRLKDNIRSIETVSDKLHKIDIKRYSMKNGSNDNAIGVIAQQVRDVFPELVSEQDDGMLTVNYRGLSSVLWKIVQEQDVKLQSIEERLAKIGA